MSNQQYIKLIKNEFQRNPKVVVRVDYLIIDDDIAITQQEDIGLSTLSQFEGRLSSVDKCVIKKVELI